MSDQEFYIGWMPKAPGSFARHAKKALLFLFPAALVIALLLASFQKKFSTASFEFGKLIEVKGIYINHPVPLLKVLNGKDIWGNASYITVPLIGYGKHGAATAIMETETEKNISLANKEVTLKGTLLYGDGKALLQINKDDNPVVNISNAADKSLLPAENNLDMQTINGEIIDPKCYFGVMKPGEGKVHRDCAIRCILGGIPPMLKVQNEKGETNYYLLAGSNINKLVQDFVAEPVSISGKLMQQDDWIVLYVEDDKSISRISKRELMKPGLVAMNCGGGCCRH